MLESAGLAIAAIATLEVAANRHRGRFLGYEEGATFSIKGGFVLEGGRVSIQSAAGLFGIAGGFYLLLLAVLC